MTARVRCWLALALGFVLLVAAATKPAATTPKSASPIQGYLVNQDIDSLLSSLNFQSRYLAAAKARFSLPPIASLPPVYQDAANNDLNKLKRRRQSELPEDPYFKVALGRLILFHEGQMTPLESERREASRLFHSALESNDPYIAWILRGYTKKDPSELGQKDPFFLMTAVLDTMRPDAASRDALDRAVAAKVKDVNFLRDLGDVLNRVGRPVDAQTVWKQALAITGSDKEVAASIQLSLGNTAGAMAIYKELYARGGKDASLYLHSLIGLYELNPTPTDGDRIEKARHLIQLGRPYAAIDIICGVESDKETGKCGTTKYPDLMILAVSTAVQQLTTALIAAGLSGSDLAESKVIQGTYVRALIDQAEVSAETQDRVAYLRGDCASIAGDPDLKKLCDIGAGAKEDAVRDMIREGEPAFITMLAGVFSDVLYVMNDPKKLLLLARESASVEAEKGNYKRAVLLIDEAIKKNAGDAGAFFDKGTYLLFVGRTRAKEADMSFRQARRMNYPNGEVVVRKIAQAILMQGKVREAAAELRDGIEKYPKSFEMRLDLLGLAFDNEAYGTAETVLRQLMDMDPAQYTTYQTRLISLYVDSVQYEKGVAEVKALYDRTWNDGYLQELANRITSPTPADATGPNGKPARKINAALWIFNASKFPLFKAYLQAADSVNKGNASKAIEILRAASQQFPEDLHLLSQVASQLWRSGSFADAKLIYAQLAQRDPILAATWTTNVELLGQLSGDSSKT